MDRDIFNQFFDLLMQLEGGYSNQLSDRGGLTKYGITEITLTAFNAKNGTKYRIKTLTLEQAKDIYYKEYFSLIKPIDNIPSYYHYFDLCVNSGYRNYQQCQADTGDDIRKVIKWRKDKYASIVNNDPSQSVFLKGWYNRLNLINQHFGIRTT